MDIEDPDFVEVREEPFRKRPVKKDPAAPLDLARVARTLASRFSGDAPRGYVRGLTAMRDALCQDLGCSQARGEQLIAELRSRGYVSYPGQPQEGIDENRVAWTFRTG